MEHLYVISAVIGGTLFVCQFFMAMLGLGHHDLGADTADGHGDVTHDHGSESSAWFFGMLTFRTLVAAITFFGLAGMAADTAKLHALLSLPIALLSALLAMFVVASVMRGLHKLEDEGTERIALAKGHSGTVYLTIPGNKTGFGKVQLDLQNRLVEYQAVTFQNQLPTGTKVIVIDVIPPDTLEVVAAPETARTQNV